MRVTNPEDHFGSNSTPKNTLINQVTFESDIEEGDNASESEVDSSRPVDVVTFDSLIATALAAHPSIAAAHQRVAAAQHRIPQATSLEDPMLGNAFWRIPDQALQTAGDRIGHQFALSQKVPWPTELDVRGAVAVREVQMALAELDRMKGTLRRQVAAAYAGIEQLELVRERIIPRTEQTLEIATANYQGKKAEFSDLVDIYRERLMSQSQLARTKATLTSTFDQIERPVGCP